MKEPLDILNQVIAAYLNSELSGRDFVRRVDDLVGDDQLVGLPVAVRTEFDRLHGTLAVCVWDDATYTEAPDAYIREADMRARVEEFARFLAAMNAGGAQGSAPGKG